MFNVPLLIGGQARPASNGKTFERCNPVSGVVVSQVAAATVEDADAAVAAAKDAFLHGLLYRQVSVVRDCCGRLNS